MLTGTGLHDPVWINTIGHTAGVLLFGLIIALLVRDRRARGVRQIGLSTLAAALALVWNIGSLIALAFPEANSILITAVMTISFSVLSLIPAVLLQVALRGQRFVLTLCGYAVSTIAVVLHVSELFVSNEYPHQWALILIASGFGVLTIVAFASRWRSISRKSMETAEWLSLASLLFFTSSFLHFGYQHFQTPWTSEIAWHHIGIPVVLIVLLQDYRFLLLDTFVRFLMNSALAAIYVFTIFLLNRRFRISDHMASSTFLSGLAVVGLCLSLILFAHIRNALQCWIGRVIFRRNDLEQCIRNIARSAATAPSEEELITSAAREVASHLRTEEFSIVKDLVANRAPDEPMLLLSRRQTSNLSLPPPWAEAQIPLQFSSGEICFLVTGSRRGRQRYLSEDLEDMRRLGSVIVEQVERFRTEELRRLVTQAELSALQAQINPHFLFNALNTLYGSIDRKSYEARRMVLNLADIFRYALQGDRSFIALSEELRIVQAYLEIEALRLGDRLETELDVDDSAASVMIPILCIQPIIENAIKHGIAPRQQRGRVTLRAHIMDGSLHVSVQDSGSGFENGKTQTGQNGAGVGLDNVRRRLQLSYGPQATLNICSSERGSTVSFRIPSVTRTASAVSYAEPRA